MSQTLRFRGLKCLHQWKSKVRLRSGTGSSSHWFQFDKIMKETCFLSFKESAEFYHYEEEHRGIYWKPVFSYCFLSLTVRLTRSFCVNNGTKTKHFCFLKNQLNIRFNMKRRWSREVQPVVCHSFFPSPSLHLSRSGQKPSNNSSQGKINEINHSDWKTIKSFTVSGQFIKFDPNLSLEFIVTSACRPTDRSMSMWRCLFVCCCLCLIFEVFHSLTFIPSKLHPTHKLVLSPFHGQSPLSIHPEI